MEEEIFSNFSVVEIPVGDYELWRWAVANRAVVDILMDLKRARVSFFIRENGKIDRASLEKNEKI